jgi:hypothetical protein
VFLPKKVERVLPSGLLSTMVTVFMMIKYLLGLFTARFLAVLFPVFRSGKTLRRNEKVDVSTVAPDSAF